MIGEFVQVGEVPFPGGDDQLMCSRFEWRPRDAARFGRFCVPFLSPNEPGPREYFVEPILNSWLDNKQSRFLERACDFGRKILRTLDGPTPEGDAFHKTLLAIFRNRHVGRTRIGRQFNVSADFVDFSGDGQLSLLTPGLDIPGDGLDLATDGSSIHGRAARLFRIAIREAGGRAAARPTRFNQVLAYYEGLLEQEARSTEPDSLGVINEVDLLFLDGVSPDLDYQLVQEHVRSALIYGPASRRDYERVSLHQGSGEVFLKKIINAVLQKNQSEFDRWLRRVRERGYLDLVEGGQRLRGREREDARWEAKCRYCQLLWLSYRMMARCYGTLMLLVRFDLSQTPALELTPEELTLFTQRNLPQAYLGGLPLNFFDVYQVRWVIRPLTRFWHGGDFNFARYQIVPDLLGIFGALVRARRHADRAAKQRQRCRVQPADTEPGAHERMIAPSSSEGDDERDTEDIWLRSPECPRCGNALQVDQRLDVTDGSRVRLRCYCSRCDEARPYLFDLDSLSQPSGTPSTGAD